jgi:hypothetical protein
MNKSSFQPRLALALAAGALLLENDQPLTATVAMR